MITWIIRTMRDWRCTTRASSDNEPRTEQHEHEHAGHRVAYIANYRATWRNQTRSNITKKFIHARQTSLQLEPISRQATLMTLTMLAILKSLIGVSNCAVFNPYWVTFITLLSDLKPSENDLDLWPWHASYSDIFSNLRNYQAESSCLK